MAKITYIESSGTEHIVDAEAGSTVMESAIKSAVPGIEAECGGACACATCQVYVAPEWQAKLLPRSEMEETMLDFAPEVRPTSRLSCQLRMSAELDGIVLNLPKSQHQL